MVKGGHLEFLTIHKEPCKLLQSLQDINLGFEFLLFFGGKKKSHCGRLNCQFLLIRNVYDRTARHLKCSGYL